MIELLVCVLGGVNGNDPWICQPRESTDVTTRKEQTKVGGNRGDHRCELGDPAKV